MSMGGQPWDVPWEVPWDVPWDVPCGTQGSLTEPMARGGNWSDHSRELYPRFWGAELL